jgi:hypothetical protein
MPVPTQAQGECDCYNGFLFPLPALGLANGINRAGQTIVEPFDDTG